MGSPSRLTSSSSWHSCPSKNPDPEGDFRASGTEYLLFWFELPDPKKEEDIQQASFDILVADNYEVWVSEVYIEVPIAQKIDPGQRNRVSYFSKVAGNDKAVVDRSNLRWVRFEYGRQTGNMVFGAHAETHVKGFEFGAEYNVNLSHFQYPDLAGTRHRRTGFAYFVKVEKSVNPRVSAGGEFFNIDPEYSTKITIQDDGFESLAGMSGAPYNTELPQGFGGHYNNTMEMDTVDDNDDKDPFPDFHWLVHERDTDGVFPGLDANLDGRPDINENRQCPARLLRTLSALQRGPGRLCLRRRSKQQRHHRCARKPTASRTIPTIKTAAAGISLPLGSPLHH